MQLKKTTSITQKEQQHIMITYYQDKCTVVHPNLWATSTKVVTSRDIKFIKSYNQQYHDCHKLSSYESIHKCIR